MCKVEVLLHISPCTDGIFTAVCVGEFSFFFFFSLRVWCQVICQQLVVSIFVLVSSDTL